MYLEGVRDAKEICIAAGISRRTLSRWVRIYRNDGVLGLQPKKPGPKYSKYAISKRLEQRILELKQKHPSWGARRIKYQYDLSCHWMTVHRVIKSNGMLVRIRTKAGDAGRHCGKTRLPH